MPYEIVQNLGGAKGDPDQLLQGLVRNIELLLAREKASQPRNQMIKTFVAG